MKSYTATINDDGVRLSRFCEKLCPKMPKSMLYKAFRNKRIKINGKKQDADYRIKKDDLIELYINDEFFETSNVHLESVNQKSEPNLNIIYQDNNIILVYKPQGLLCHSDNKNEKNLIDIIINHLHSTGEFNAVNENCFTPALCNRIDQGTEGIVIAAKNYHALSAMNEIIRDNLLEKLYIAVTHKSVNGVFTAFLTRNKQTKKVKITENAINNESKKIITEFETVKQKNGYCLIECRLITGRTHQIRAHLAYLNASIIGDKKYGIIHKNLKSQLLCACKIKFKKIPSNNYLSYLSEKEFNLEKSFVQNFFDNL